MYDSLLTEGATLIVKKGYATERESFNAAPLPPYTHVQPPLHCADCDMSVCISETNRPPGCRRVRSAEET